MKRISTYAALFAALAGLLIMGCDSGSDGGNEPSSPLTITNGTVISCDRLAKGSVEIPAGVNRIEDYAFIGCTGVTSVTIPTGVKTIGVYAFSGCTELRSVTIPETVRYIAAYTFFDSGLRSVEIPVSVTAISSDAFKGRLSLDVYYDGTEEQWRQYFGFRSDIGSTIYGKDNAIWYPVR